MAIRDAIIKTVKYPPELIPDSWYGTVPNVAEIAPAILDLVRFKPYLVRLAGIQLAANAAVILRARYDGVRVDENTGAMINLIPGFWDLPAKDFLRYNLFGLAPGLLNQTTHYGVWAQIPTVADKLLHGLPLTPDEQKLSQELGIANAVQKGVLPLPIGVQIEREYHILGEETHSRSVNVTPAGTAVSIESIYARQNEFLVLTKMAAAPGAAAAIVEFIVDRDDDAGFATVRTFPLSLAFGGEINCFVPAMHELRLTANSTVAALAHLFRYTYQRIRLTNTLRVRFGLVTRDELREPSLWDKVKGGVL